MNPTQYQHTSTREVRREVNPVEEANPLSRYTFWWLYRLFRLGLQRPIEPSDIYETLTAHQSEQLAYQFEDQWKRELAATERSPQLLRVIAAIYGWKLLCYGFLYTLIDSFARIFQPQCLGGLVSYFVPGQQDVSRRDALYYALGIILCSLVPVVIFHHFILRVFQIGMQVRVACCSLLYKKALRITKSAGTDGLAGQVINLMSTDVAKFDLAVGFLHDIWKGPIELAVLGYFIYHEIGVAGLFGIAFLLSFIPLQAWAGKMAATYRLRTAERTDRRVRFMDELLQGIRVIKMYAWEDSFSRMVDRIRRKEINGIRGTLFVRAGLLSFNLVSRLSIFLSLVAYVWRGNVFTAKKVFIVTSYFNLLYGSMLQFWPLALTFVAEGFVSVRRIQAFLLLEERKMKWTAGQPVPPVDESEVKLMDGGKASAVQMQHRPGGSGRTNSKRLVRNRKTFSRLGVFMKNGTAAWDKELPDTAAELRAVPGLRDVTLTVEKSKLCAVVGPVGSGKSTLLQVILGELELDDGRLVISGDISYAPQEPWLFEGSVKNNIVFTEDYHEKRYREVVKVCALERDFRLLPDGDRTVVGERGTSLSGGQRARVSLARAVYRQADIYLLDDPLSAVDAHVGKHIFEQCIVNYLKDKVCVLVTHQHQYLEDIEHVVLMNMGGVAAQGPYRSLAEDEAFPVAKPTAPPAMMDVMAAQNDTLTEDSGHESDTASLATTVGQRQQSVRRHQPPSPYSSSSMVCDGYDNRPEVATDAGEHAESQVTGTVGYGVYRRYFQSVESGLLLVTVGALFLLAQTTMSGIDYFISQWVNWEEHLSALNTATNGTTVPVPTRLAGTIFVQLLRQDYVLIYAIAMLAMLALSLNRSFSFFYLCLRASVHLHDRLFRGITRATMHFFHTNPSGRILNRFSRDIGCIDTVLPFAMMDCILFFIEFAAIICLVAVVNYWLLVPTFVMAIVFYVLRHIYTSTARSIKRVEAITRSPIISHANASFQGLTTIRAFRAEKILAYEFDKHQDLNTSAWYLYLATTRAFAFWLELVCVLYIAVVTLSFLLVDDSMSGNVGLAITQVFNLIFMCQWGIRQTAELENQMTSVERVIEYAELESEPSLETSPEQRRPPDEWPTAGSILFGQFSLRYAPDSDAVLHDLNLSIGASEKIGIVGRTGAGKSSIIQALFRLAINEGRIEVDGWDISALGLHDLRRKISIIPQEPVLFSGTVRENLDPFQQHDDDAMWRALGQVELADVVTALDGGLDGRMADGGSNFSMGQRQLICLARAILRNNRILVLDEATANVDPETDQLIQRTIREQFKDCTVLTVAHRLHTVMDSDRVLVMDGGRAVEFGHPHELLQQTDGGFLVRLVAETGPTMAATLTAMAEDNYRQRQMPTDAGQ